MGLRYNFNGDILPEPRSADGVRLLSMEGAVFGADGQSYFTWVNQITQPDLGLGRSGGGSMSDPVVGRPPASTFIVKIGYVAGRRTDVVEVSGRVIVGP
jgi:hypothetical protein